MGQDLEGQEATLLPPVSILELTAPEQAVDRWAGPAWHLLPAPHHADSPPAGRLSKVLPGEMGSRRKKVQGNHEEYFVKFYFQSSTREIFLKGGALAFLW